MVTVTSYNGYGNFDDLWLQQLKTGRLRWLQQFQVQPRQAVTGYEYELRLLRVMSYEFSSELRWAGAHNLLMQDDQTSGGGTSPR